MIPFYLLLKNPIPFCFRLRILGQCETSQRPHAWRLIAKIGLSDMSLPRWKRSSWISWVGTRSFAISNFHEIWAAAWKTPCGLWLMLGITIHSRMGQGLGAGLFGNSTPILYKWISCHISIYIIYHHFPYWNCQLGGYHILGHTHNTKICRDDEHP